MYIVVLKQTELEVLKCFLLGTEMRDRQIIKTTLHSVSCDELLLSAKFVLSFRHLKFSSR